MADILTAPPGEAMAAGLASPANEIRADLERTGSTGDVLKSRMPQLVKGSVNPGLKPHEQNMDVLMKAHQATLDLRTATWRGYNDKQSVVKSMNGDFLSQRGFLKTALNAPSIGEQLQQVLGAMPGGGDALKSFTAGNLGIGSVYGLVPFDLNGVLAR